MQMIIRPARIADAASLARVRLETWRTSYRGLIPEAVIAGMDMKRKPRAGMNACGHRRRTLTCLWRSPVGLRFRRGLKPIPRCGRFLCGGGPDRDADPDYSGELYAIYVLQAYQGQGVGRALVSAAVDWLRQNGHQSMLIWVLRDNHPARRFYEALGGKAVRERSIDIGGAPLPEVGYGYDLSRWPARY